MTFQVFPDSEVGRAQLLFLGEELKKFLAERDERGQVLEEDLVRAIDQQKSWQILQHVDRGVKPPEDYTNEHWSEEELLDSERDQFFTFVYNASMINDKIGAPGYQKGHDMLLQRIAENPRSFFYNHIDHRTHKELVNGAFWENIPDLHPAYNYGMAYGPVEKILVQQFTALDPNWTRSGLDLIAGRGTQWDHIRLNSVSRGISKKAIKAYGAFVQSIDAIAEETGITGEEMKNLAGLYIKAIQFRSDDRIEEEFQDREELMQEPLVLKYMN